MSSNTILKRNLLISSEVSSNKIYNKFGNLIKATVILIFISRMISEMLGATK